MEGESQTVERKKSVFNGPASSEEVKLKTRSPSPEDRFVKPVHVLKNISPRTTPPKDVPTITIGRHRNQSESQSYADTEVLYKHTVCSNSSWTI